MVTREVGGASTNVHDVRSDESPSSVCAATIKFEHMPTQQNLFRGTPRYCCIPWCCACCSAPQVMRSNMYAGDNLLSVLNIQAVNGECAACESGGVRELDAWSQEVYTKGRHPISMYSLYREARRRNRWYPDKVSRRGISDQKVCVFLIHHRGLNY